MPYARDVSRMRHDVPHAPDLRIRTGAAVTRRSSGYAPDAAEMDTGEKGIYAIAVKCELFINYADD